MAKDDEKDKVLPAQQLQSEQKPAAVDSPTPEGKSEPITAVTQKPQGEQLNNHFVKADQMGVGDRNGIVGPKEFNDYAKAVGSGNIKAGLNKILDDIAGEGKQLTDQTIKAYMEKAAEGGQIKLDDPSLKSRSGKMGVEGAIENFKDYLKSHGVGDRVANQAQDKAVDGKTAPEDKTPGVVINGSAPENAEQAEKTKNHNEAFGDLAKKTLEAQKAVDEDDKFKTQSQTIRDNKDISEIEQNRLIGELRNKMITEKLATDPQVTKDMEAQGIKGEAAQKEHLANMAGKSPEHLEKAQTAAKDANKVNDRLEAYKQELVKEGLSPEEAQKRVTELSKKMVEEAGFSGAKNHADGSISIPANIKNFDTMAKMADDNNLEAAIAKDKEQNKAKEEPAKDAGITLNPATGPSKDAPAKDLVPPSPAAADGVVAGAAAGIASSAAANAGINGDRPKAATPAPNTASQTPEAKQPAAPAIPALKENPEPVVTDKGKGGNEPNIPPAPAMPEEASPKDKSVAGTTEDKSKPAAQTRDEKNLQRDGKDLVRNTGEALDDAGRAIGALRSGNIKDAIGHAQDAVGNIGEAGKNAAKIAENPITQQKMNEVADRQVKEGNKEVRTAEGNTKQATRAREDAQSETVNAAERTSKEAGRTGQDLKETAGALLSGDLSKAGQKLSEALDSAGKTVANAVDTAGKGLDTVKKFGEETKAQDTLVAAKENLDRAKENKELIANNEVKPDGKAENQATAGQDKKTGDLMAGESGKVNKAGKQPQYEVAQANQQNKSAPTVGGGQGQQQANSVA